MIYLLLRNNLIILYFISEYNSLIFLQLVTRQIARIR